MMRRSAALFLTLAATMLAAAKPAPPEDAVVGPADTAGNWRSQAVAACIDTLHAIPDLSPDNLESICGCAANAAAEDNGAGALPPVERGRFPAPMRSRLGMCAAQIRPERTGEIVRLAMNASRPPSSPAELPGMEAKPAGDADIGPPPENGSRNEGGGFMDWVRSISLPAWLTGADILLWVALGIFVFGLLVLKLRARDPRNDLLGPPSSMRRGAPPQPPRRPDLPR